LIFRYLFLLLPWGHAAAYAVLVRIRQVREAARLLVVVVTEVEVEDDTKKNLGSLLFRAPRQREAPNNRILAYLTNIF